MRNPFPFRVRATVDLLVRRGAFEVEGLPEERVLAPGASFELAPRLRGGSWSPGGDPLLVCAYDWREGPGRPMGRLVLDAPLHRRRSLTAFHEPRRVMLLRERPGDAEASMSVRRTGPFVVCGIENTGGLTDARAMVNVDGSIRRGSVGVRATLPPDFDHRPGGIPFSVGLEGRDPVSGALRVRRWSGGIPEGVLEGAPGRLLPL